MSLSEERRKVERTEVEVKPHTPPTQKRVALKSARRRPTSWIMSGLDDASRRAGMAEVAAEILHNIGNVLNSVTVSAAVVRETLATSRLSGLRKAAELLAQEPEALNRFLTEDERGRKLPRLIALLVDHLEEERRTLEVEVKGIAERVEHMRSIIMAQQDCARAGAVIEVVEPTEILEAAVRMSCLEDEGVCVVRDYEVVPALRMDRHRFLQVVTNLLRNARHAVRGLRGRAPEVTVAARLSEVEQLQVIVADNGIGIPRDSLEKIFQLGFTTKSSGNGLGLHSSANAARVMGGSLRAESDGPDRGATFVLELPAAPA
jgi:signal transduction histidine kinase